MPLTKKDKELVIKQDEATSKDICSLTDERIENICAGKDPEFTWYSEELSGNHKGSTWLLPTSFVDANTALLEHGLHKEPWSPGSGVRKR